MCVCVWKWWALMTEERLRYLTEVSEVRSSAAVPPPERKGDEAGEMERKWK